MSSDIEWCEPPARTPSRAERVAAQLRSRPGKWAKIEHQAGIQMFPWWTPLHNMDEFETHIHVPNRQGPFDLSSPRDIYARYIGGETGEGG